MTADGTYTAVLDRFEDGSSEDGPGERAVLLLESGDEVVAERAIPTWRLPEDARRQDAVLELSVNNGFVVSMEYDPEQTERRTSEAQSRFDRLAERPGEGSDGGNDEES
jgi:hypothetical protein